MSVHAGYFHRISSLAAKVFRVKTGISSFTIRLFGRTLMSYKRTIIMKFTTAHNKHTVPAVPVHAERITESNIGDYVSVDSGILGLISFLEQKHGSCEAFGLRTDDNSPAGCAWVLYRGGRIDKFRFENIDAWIFAVYTAEKYRRKGCCEYLLNHIFRYLHDEKGIDCVYLDVRKNNHPARAAYNKLGGTEARQIRKFRFLRIYFPSKHITL